MFGDVGFSNSVRDLNGRHKINPLPQTLLLVDSVRNKIATIRIFLGVFQPRPQTTHPLSIRHFRLDTQFSYPTFNRSSSRPRSAIIQNEYFPLLWRFEPSPKYSHPNLQYATAKVVRRDQF